MDDGSIAEILNLIGALFVLDPQDARMQPVLAGLTRQPAASAEPAEPAGGNDATVRLLARLGRPLDRAELHRTYLDLFIGPAPLEAPPWGSVYLDAERALYGASTTLLRDFLRREAIAATGPDAGPEDHFGVLCWLGAWLAAEGRMPAFDELLGEHLMPWAPLYLQELRRVARARLAAGEAAAAFYADAAELAAAVLSGIVDGRAIPVGRRTLYPGTTDPGTAEPS